MDTKKLEALAAAVEYGSFTRAAENLGYTQSGLTHMMNSLEKDIGFPVLLRGRQGVRLTPAGERIFPLIRNLLDAISHATCGMANDVHAKAIVVNTLSGKTARMVSRFRPAADIVGFTTSEKTWRKLALSWGVTPQLSPVYDGITSMFTATAQETKKLLGLKSGDKIVLTGGLTDGTSGNTDLVKIQTM